MERIIRFFKDEDGLELSEYAVMGGLIILGLVTVITGLHDQIETVFSSITSAMTAS
jgi:pilus assembly protein Flp/PilA